MNRIILIIFMSFILVSQAKTNKSSEAFKAVDKFFLAISEVKHKDIKKQVTDSFVLLENGEVWTIDDLIEAVTPQKFERDNYFSIINMKSYKDIVTINYWNKANFHNSNYNVDVIWLESVVIEKIKGKWLISQMHSTKLPSGTEPENVVFTKQNS